MRYKMEPSGEKFVVFDNWWLDPEKKEASNAFIVCECWNEEAANKIVRALNEYEGTAENWALSS